jgi:hypothetical protein
MKKPGTATEGLVQHTFSEIRQHDIATMILSSVFGI